MTKASDLMDRVREGLEDYGNTVTDRFTGDGATTIWIASNPPVKTSTDTVTLAGVPTTAYSVNYNTGEFTFGVAPGAVTVQFQYTKVLYRDERLLTALAEGVRRMFPWVYKNGECYVALNTQKFNYDLQSTTDVPAESSFGSGIVPSDYVASTARTDLAKAQSRIHRFEYLPVGYASQAPWRPVLNFRRSTVRDLETDTPFNPGDTLKIVYSAPCTAPTAATDVLDLPDAYIDLPVWYAAGTLLARKESVRVRSDALFPQGYGVMTTPPGSQRITGDDYLKLFWQTLQSSPMPPMRTEIRRVLPGYARRSP